MLSRFACLLAAVGGRSGCTAPSSEGRVLGCVGMLRHGAHLQLPTLGLSAKPLVSGVIQEWYEISRQGSWCQLGNHSTTQNTTDFIHCLVPACFLCTSSLWAAAASAPHPHQAEGAGWDLAACTAEMTQQGRVKTGSPRQRSK